MRIALFILAIVSGLVFGSTLTSKHLKRSYTYQCANLSGTDLYVTLPSGEKYYAGKIGHCGCASAAWVENAVSNSVDDAIDSAADNAGLDETTQEVENLVSGQCAHSYSTTQTNVKLFLRNLRSRARPTYRPASTPTMRRTPAPPATSVILFAVTAIASRTANASATRQKWSVTANASLKLAARRE